MPQKVLVIGGLGFIGYHVSTSLMKNDFDVTIAQRSEPHNYESEFNLFQLDLKNMRVSVISELIKEYRHIVFCGGADDRTMPNGNAASFYFEENVLPCLKLVEAAIDTKVEKVLILGSYFSYFDRSKPEWKLSQKHPYLKSRKLQQEKTLEIADNKVQVSTLEIPYVFGASPGKIPLWKPLVDYIRHIPVVFYTKGGTNIMSVEQVSQAVLGILNSSNYKPRWTIGSENVSWIRLIQMIAQALRKERRVITMPNFIIKPLAQMFKLYLKLSKKETGLDPYHFIDVQTTNTFLDISDVMKELNYGNAGMQESIDKTVKACGYDIDKK